VSTYGSSLSLHAWSGVLCTCSHLSSDESRLPGPLQMRNSESRPFRIRCSRTVANLNLRLPLHWEHGQCSCFKLNSLARCNSRIHKRSSLRRCRCGSVKGTCAGIMSPVHTRENCRRCSTEICMFLVITSKVSIISSTYLHKVQGWLYMTPA
jgi:hypothetical protein